MTSPCASASTSTVSGKPAPSRPSPHQRRLKTSCMRSPVQRAAALTQSQHRVARPHVVCHVASNEQVNALPGTPQPSPPVSTDEHLSRLVVEADIAAGRLTVRCVEPKDVLGACVVLTRAFAGTPEEIGLNDARKYVDNVLSSPGGGALFVARLIPTDESLLPPGQASRLVGTVALSLREETLQQIPTLPPPKNTAYLSNMAVDAKFRRQGVARALMRICDQAAAAAGLPEIFLHVRQGDDAAFRLYSGAGYTEVARDNFLAARLKNVRPRILMQKRLL